jgi:hypothetical protein
VDNVKSTNSNKKWIDIDISMHTLECKEAVTKFKILGRHEYLAHHFKRMNLIDLDICFLCNQNPIMNSVQFTLYRKTTKRYLQPPREAK